MVNGSPLDMNGVIVDVTEIRIDDLVTGNRILVADGSLGSVTIATIVSVRPSDTFPNGIILELFQGVKETTELHDWNGSGLVQLITLHGASVVNLNEVYSL